MGYPTAISSSSDGTVYVLTEDRFHKPVEVRAVPSKPEHHQILKFSNGGFSQLSSAPTNTVAIVSNSHRVIALTSDSRIVQIADGQSVSSLPTSLANAEMMASLGENQVVIGRHNGAQIAIYDLLTGKETIFALGADKDSGLWNFSASEGKLYASTGSGQFSWSAKTVLAKSLKQRPTT